MQQIQLLNITVVLWSQVGGKWDSNEHPAVLDSFPMPGT